LCFYVYVGRKGRKSAKGGRRPQFNQKQTKKRTSREKRSKTPAIINRKKPWKKKETGTLENVGDGNNMGGEKPDRKQDLGPNTEEHEKRSETVARGKNSGSFKKKNGGNKRNGGGRQSLKNLTTATSRTRLQSKR